jgi:MOSC domain-containing protein
MWIAELWRYPVKSMAGEALQSAEVREDGIMGDRLVAVRDGRGRVVTARSRPALLAHCGTLGADGEPHVDGRLWRLADVLRDVRAAVGDERAELFRWDGPGRFDVLPLLVATDGAVQAFGYDGRRLRPNIVIGGVPGLAERRWEGGTLRVGEVVIGVQDLRQRCIMTTFDPDTQEQDVEVLKRIHQEFGGSLALNCRVIRGGTLQVGEPVEFVARESPM